MKRYCLAAAALMLWAAIPTPAMADPISAAIATLGAFGAGSVLGGPTLAAIFALSTSVLINVLASKPNPERQASIASLAIGEQPRVAIFGISAVPGTLA